MILNLNKKANSLSLGCDLDTWSESGFAIPIATDLSSATNSHILICGMSGGGKTYAEEQIFAKMILSKAHGEFFFADYKGDDSFAHLRGLPRYFSYKDTLQALDAVYDRLQARISGDDDSRYPITLIWDEYMANALALTNEDKKLAAVVMNKVSEILLMGRSMSVRLVTSMQRPDAVAFPSGSRLNYGVVLVLGAAVRSIYEMLLPDFMDKVQGRQFGLGEGVVLLQGSQLHFVKIGIHNADRVQDLCIQALSKEI